MVPRFRVMISNEISFSQDPRSTCTCRRRQPASALPRFRGVKSVARTGDTIHILANTPHQFHNKGTSQRVCCAFGSPAGLEESFTVAGVPVASRTTAPPKLDAAAQAAFIANVAALAPKCKTELLRQVLRRVSTCRRKSPFRPPRQRHSDRLEETASLSCPSGPSEPIAIWFWDFARCL
jgi:hypothetical protein